MSFWRKLYYWFVGFVFGMMMTCTLFVYARHSDETNALKERLPEVREIDAQQLPPGAKNLRGLGNRWILFEMDVEGKPQKFIFRRGQWRDQPDVLVHVP
jgi:hypothetical protein